METLGAMLTNIDIPHAALKGRHSVKTDKLSPAEAAGGNDFAAIFAQLLLPPPAAAGQAEKQPDLERRLSFGRYLPAEGKTAATALFTADKAAGRHYMSGGETRPLVARGLVSAEKLAAMSGTVPFTQAPRSAGGQTVTAAETQARRQSLPEFVMSPAGSAADKTRRGAEQSLATALPDQTRQISTPVPDQLRQTVRLSTLPPIAAALKADDMAAAADRSMSGTAANSSALSNFPSLLRAEDSNARWVAEAFHARAGEGQGLAAAAGQAKRPDATERSRFAAENKNPDGQAGRADLTEPRSLYLKETGNLTVALSGSDAKPGLPKAAAADRALAPASFSVAEAANNLSPTREKSAAGRGEIHNLTGDNGSPASLFNAALKGARGTEQPLMAASQLDMLSERMVSRLKQGASSLEVQLQPESLGKIKLLMQMENGALLVRIVAHTEEARHLLDANLSNIREGLNQQGIKVAEMSLDFAQQQGSGQQTGNEGQEAGRSAKTSPSLTENQAALKAEEVSASADNRLNLWA